MLTTDANGEEVVQNKAFKTKFLRPTRGNILLKAAVQLIKLPDAVLQLFPENQQGHVVGFDGTRDRWKIRILPGDSVVLLPESNLRRIDSTKLTLDNQHALDGDVVLSLDDFHEPRPEGGDEADPEKVYASKFPDKILDITNKGEKTLDVN